LIFIQTRKFKNKNKKDLLHKSKPNKPYKQTIQTNKEKNLTNKKYHHEEIRKYSSQSRICTFVLSLYCFFFFCWT